jgi:small subunit ribosomal protein S8e
MVGRPATMTKIGEEKRKSVRTKGGSSKEKLLNATIANLTDPKTKKTIKATIKDVLENPANRYFVRRDIITKGTIIETDKGNAKVTSRPGQDGVVNAVLME